MTLRYRLGQLARALRPSFDDRDCALLNEILSPAERSLFESMALYAQRHSLDVCWTLRAVGQEDRNLLRAALLHDCGKTDDDGCPIPLVYYGLFVVLLRVAPGLYRAAAISGRGILRPFRVHAEHEMRSARLAATAGCPPEVIALIVGYHHAPPDTLGGWLRWADDRC